MEVRALNKERCRGGYLLTVVEGWKACTLCRYFSFYFWTIDFYCKRFKMCIFFFSLFEIVTGEIVVVEGEMKLKFFHNWERIEIFYAYKLRWNYFEIIIVPFYVSNFVLKKTLKKSLKIIDKKNLNKETFVILMIQR